MCEYTISDKTAIKLCSIYKYSHKYCTHSTIHVTLYRKYLGFQCFFAPKTRQISKVDKCVGTRFPTKNLSNCLVFKNILTNTVLTAQYTLPHNPISQIVSCAIFFFVSQTRQIQNLINVWVQDLPQNSYQNV